jgi:hypothetical protein
VNSDGVSSGFINPTTGGYYTSKEIKEVGEDVFRFNEYVVAPSPLKEEICNKRPKSIIKGDEKVMFLSRPRIDCSEP